MKKDFLKSIIVLTVICLITAALMGAINSVTAPMIEKANEEAEFAALYEVIDGASDFEKLNSDDESIPDTVVGIYRERLNKGYAVMLNAKGYGSEPMVIAVGIDFDGKLTKCHVVSCNGETSGIGTKVSEKRFLDTFSGQDKTLEGVDSIGGATISSSAFISAVGDAFTAYELVKEGK